MKILLAYEHIRRLVGAHSQMVTAFGRAMVDAGHDVTIICDTVIDPEPFQEFRFVARRPFTWGDSSRLLALRRWAEHTIPTLESDVVISFHPAFPAPVYVPLFAWHSIQSQQIGQSFGDRLNPRIMARVLIERRAKQDARTKRFIALSEELAFMMREVLPNQAAEVMCIPGVSPIVPPESDADRRQLREEGRALLRLEEDDVAFLWAGKRPSFQGRRKVLEAFAELKRSGQPPAKLIVASGETWQPHDHAVSRRFDDDIRVVGRTQDMELLLAACDVGLMPARFSVLGRFIWECLAFGKPVIASTRAASVSRLRATDERVAGRIVRSDDVLALVAAMKEMVDNSTRESAAGVARSIGSVTTFPGFAESLLQAAIMGPQAASERRAGARRGR